MSTNTVPASANCALSLQTGSVGTDNNTNEKTLFTYNLPANTLDTTVKALRIKAFGTMANNAHVKTVKLYFGSQAATLTLTPSVDGAWVVDSLTIGTNSAQNMQITGLLIDMGTFTPQILAGLLAPVEDGTAPIVIKITGQNGTATVNDIVCKGMAIELLQVAA